MTALRRWRRWAVKLSQHAAWVLPGGRSPWAAAMRRELDYIEDDRAALRWALGCVVASYKVRLTTWSNIGARDILRRAAASGALMLIIGFALLGHAESQTEPPQPVLDGTCGTPDTSPDLEQSLPSGSAGVSRETDPPARTPDPAPEMWCADRNAPARAVLKHQTR
jgi:hypothetical protein